MTNERCRKVCLLAVFAAAGNPASLVGQAIEQWTLVEELRIGAVDDPDYALTEIGDVRIAPNGDVLVVQNQANHVVVFDSAGVRSHVVGQRGAGPGEFVGRISLTWLKADTLGAFDLDQQRYSVFLADGTHVHTGRILPEGSIGTVVLESLLGDGTAVGYPRAALRSGVKHLLRYGRNGELLDTLAVARIGTFMAEAVLDNGRRIRFAKPEEFRQGDLVALDPAGGGMIVVERQSAATPDRHRFHVTRVRVSGDTVFRRSYGYVPRMMSEGSASESLSQFRAALLEMSRKNPGIGGGTYNSDELDRMIEALDAPAFHPPVSAVVAGSDGTIWLRREPVHEERVGWVVLGERGEPIALADAPRDFEVRSATRDRVWGVVRDDLDVSYLVRYRIESRP